MKDVVPITDMVDIPAFLVATTKNFDVNSVPELVAYAKKNPGQVRYGTVGPGSYPHYDMAYFAKRAGDLDMVAMPNKAGAAGVINDMLTGSTQVAFLNVASTAPQVKAGNLRPLAVVDHARLPEFPDLPTMQEIGFPGVGTIAWQGLFAPAGTPKDVLQTIFDATVAAMKTPAATDAFKKQTFNIVPNASLADAKTWLGREMDTWRKITSEVKIEYGVNRSLRGAPTARARKSDSTELAKLSPQYSPPMIVTMDSGAPALGARLRNDERFICS